MNERSILRALAIERDGWHCTRCGVAISDALPDWHPRKAEMAHIIGLGRGGQDVLGNVEMCCHECHGDEHRPKALRAK